MVLYCQYFIQKNKVQGITYIETGALFPIFFQTVWKRIYSLSKSRHYNVALNLYKLNFRVATKFLMVVHFLTFWYTLLWTHLSHGTYKMEHNFRFYKSTLSFQNAICFMSILKINFLLYLFDRQIIELDIGY